MCPGRSSEERPSAAPASAAALPSAAMNDLAIVVVSTNEAHWLEPCLSSVLAHAGPIDLDIVVADNASTDGTRELVEDRFPQARVVRCENRGFSHANNRALMTCDARYLLLLNPDTEIRDGTFADLLAVMDARPEVGFASVRQVLADGTLYPTIRRFPSPLRALGEALGAERPGRGRLSLGERVLDPAPYERETEADWLTGAYMLLRREALEGAGLLDERFFMSSEETDLCFRVKAGGWRVVHLPAMTILHHAGKRGTNPRMDAQYAFARRLFARKHLAPAARAAYLAALGLRYGLRAVAPDLRGEAGDEGTLRRASARLSLETLAGLRPPPFGPPPPTAVAPWEASGGPREGASSADRSAA
jgi:GT2 family glycosyltransferase